ncbi:heparinase II/III-family protein [bacterium]|nr:heparinase II/III-family protein [bacterium]
MVAFLLVASVAMLLLCCQVSAQPALWFAQEDLPRLEAAAAAEPEAAVWRALLAQAEGYCTPGSGQYATPEQVAQRPAGDKRVQILGHFFGRRLTDWMEALGFAYQLTGDERFARHGVLLLTTAAAQLPVTDPDIAKGFAGARGDIMRGLAVGYDWLGEAMTPEQKAAWAETAAGYVRNIVAEATGEKVWWRPYHNFMGVAMGAAGLLALELRPLYPQEAPGWLATCTNMVGQWLDEGWDAQGAYSEGTMYGQYGLSNAIRFADALKRSGGPDLLQRPHVKQIPDFYALSLLPGERVFEARNDANYSSLDDPTMIRLATALDSGVASWLWQSSGGGTSPFRLIWSNRVAPTAPSTAEPPGSHFPGRGLCIWRTGWGQGDVMLSVEAGPFHAVTHNQGDKGSFTLYGLGQRWAIDSGYGNNRQPGGRDSTMAHNCVLIDGEGQAPSGAGAGTNGQIVAYENTATCGYALADATEAYNHNAGGQPGVGVERARRHVCFVRPSGGAAAYGVVCDDIRKDAASHEYTWLLHLPADMRVETQPDGAVITPGSAFAHSYIETPLQAEGRGAAAWTFEAPEAGDYVLWARVRATGEELGKSDSFFVQMDEGQPTDWHMPGGQEWTWGKVAAGVAQQPLSYRLTAGRHTLRFLTRETGAQVSEAALTTNTQAAPPFAAGTPAIPLPVETASVTPPMRLTTVPGDPKAPHMRLWLTAAAPVRYAVDSYDGHQRLKAIVSSVQPDFAAVLLPLPAGTVEPQVRVERTAEALVMRLQWPGRHDEIRWPTAGDRRPIVTVGIP